SSGKEAELFEAGKRLSAACLHELEIDSRIWLLQQFDRYRLRSAAADAPPSFRISSEPDRLAVAAVAGSQITTIARIDCGTVRTRQETAAAVKQAELPAAIAA